jgi:alpha-beta hydrolase superfamily lysophospholipase
MKLEVISREPKSETHSTPLLFVHGMWHGAWCWAEHFLLYFAKHGYSSYALSLRGHAGSEGHKRLRWNTLANYVSDVKQVVNEMKRPPVLVGHSMGGMIVQKYLESHQAPAAVLLASAPPKGLLPATLRAAILHPLVFLKVNLTLRTYPVVGTPGLCREMLFSSSMSEPEVEKYYSRMQDESFRAYVDMMFLNLPRPARVKSPVLVLGAANDKAIAVSEVEATARAYGTQAEFFPNMAHDMMLEAGWQAVADRVLSWLQNKGL